MGKNYVEKIHKKLKMAYAQILVAENIKRNKRQNALKSLYVLAMTGNIFATPEFLASVYISSSMSEVKKARKILEKALKKEDISMEDRLLLKQLESVLKPDKEIGFYDLKIMVAEALRILESAPLL